MGSPEIWELRIYVAGKTPRSLAALSNLKRICEQHLKTATGCRSLIYWKRLS